jgi:DnaK suppressor protein
MDIQHFKEGLIREQQDLESQAARLKDEVEAPEGDYAEDWVDEATVEVGKTESMGGEAVLNETLSQVRDALQRTADGAYGKCVVCGRPIEPARLEAIPWTPYCLDDQKKVDRQAGQR